MLPVLNSEYVLSRPDLHISKEYFNYPEKVLQFGTGVLLRGLVDYLIDKANKQGLFKGRVVVVKSTDGPTTEFSSQDNLYTTHIKGVAQCEKINRTLINASISRVLQSNADWAQVLETVHQPELQVIISNTTEVGIQYVAENISDGVPASFPGKLLAVLWERFQYFQGSADKGFVIVPTELVVDNGRLLQEIVLQLAAFNQLPAAFTEWIKNSNNFCNSLVDRIVPGKPKDLETLQEKAGYTDSLWIDAEPFLLWAIEGDAHIKQRLSFHEADARMLIAPSITPYREQKLRILNGSHTISVPLAFLGGLNTVYECMEHSYMHSFFRTVVMEEILPTIQDICPHADNFAQDVLDRFANPNIAHKLISITFQESSKMNARNVRTLLRYYERKHTLPPAMCLGFAAMLLFLRPVKEEGGKFFGARGTEQYVITDDNAAVFAGYWKEVKTADSAAVTQLVQQIISDTRLWEADLNQLPGFAETVSAHLLGMMQEGTLVYADGLRKAVK